MTAMLLVLGAFVAMEPLTYLTHRFVMHGLGRAFHRSHHRRWPARRDGDGFLEGNDVFPLVFATMTMGALAVGFNVRGAASLVALAVGVTAYGMAYAFVHDVYTHQRVAFRRRAPWLDRLANAHALHHRYGGEPYGMLLPIVPAALRERDRARRSSAERTAAVPRP